MEEKYVKDLRDQIRGANTIVTKEYGLYRGLKAHVDARIYANGNEEPNTPEFKKLRRAMDDASARYTEDLNLLLRLRRLLANAARAGITVKKGGRTTRRRKHHRRSTRTLTSRRR